MSLPYRPPRRLAAAALEHYAGEYGASVAELDRRLAETPAPPGLIDLTHGDTQAFEPPAQALEDFAAGLSQNCEAYTPYRGSAGVRRALAPRLGRLLGRPVDPASELVISPGSQGALFAALSALVEPGDRVLVPDPDYFANERIVAYLGGDTSRVPVVADRAGLLHLDEAALAAAGAAPPAVIALSHPNNPTGGLYAPESAAALAALAVQAGAWVVLDQLYCRLIFSGRRLVPIGLLPGMAERTVTLLGPSKTESMSGFRVGVAVAPAAVTDAMERVLSLASIRAGGYSQQTLRHWLDDDEEWLAERVAAHERLRDKLLARLRSIPGVEVSPPAGSSYVFPDASGSPLGQRLERRLGRRGTDGEIACALKRAGVLVNPGYQFGPAGRGHFRVNFSQHAGRLDEAMDLVEKVLAD